MSAKNSQFMPQKCYFLCIFMVRVWAKWGCYYHVSTQRLHCRYSLICWQMGMLVSRRITNIPFNLFNQCFFFKDTYSASEKTQLALFFFVCFFSPVSPVFSSFLQKDTKAEVDEADDLNIIPAVKAVCKINVRRNRKKTFCKEYLYRTAWQICSAGLFVWYKKNNNFICSLVPSVATDSIVKKLKSTGFQAWSCNSHVALIVPYSLAYFDGVHHRLNTSHFCVPTPSKAHPQKYKIPCARRVFRFTLRSIEYI